VNIPDFHAEVFEDHKRVMRFRVVVGNNQRRCDPKTKKWTYPNATPVQMALMDHLEVNPFWNVPERIIEEEFEAEIERDPNWLEKNNYELVKSRQGNTWIRQKPGPQNALGIVKFIFPNRHNTYMHDTPKKKYFDYPVRAFSHGCVRVEHPEELARYLLTKDTLATSEEFEALVSSQQTKRFLVKDKMPVFFEYYIAQVGDDGHVHFLADIYRLDERRASGDTETFDSCLVPQKSQTAGDGELTNPAETGRDYGP
jgi:murein L,D-transpeptidase YcbB/YkuD